MQTHGSLALRHCDQINIISTVNNSLKSSCGLNLPCVCQSGCAPSLYLHQQEHHRPAGAPLCTASHSEPGGRL